MNIGSEHVNPDIDFEAVDTGHLDVAVVDEEVLKRYIPVGGVRIEDDILVTKKGYENLTTAPKGEEMLKIIRESARKS